MIRPRILQIPIALGVSAAVPFLLQGGFGGGRGSLDRIIFALGLPGVLVTVVLPVWPGDFIGLIFLPALINIALWFAAARAFLAVRRRRANPSQRQI